MIEQGGKQEEPHKDGQACDHIGNPRNRPGLKIDSRSGKGAGDRITASQGSNHIGQPLANQFLVGIKALPGFGRHGLGHGNGLHKPQKGDDHGIGKQPQHDCAIQGGH